MSAAERVDNIVWSWIGMGYATRRWWQREDVWSADPYRFPVLGEGTEGECLYVPADRYVRAARRDLEKPWVRVNPWNPTHWPYIIGTLIARQITCLDDSP